MASSSSRSRVSSFRTSRQIVSRQTLESIRRNRCPICLSWIEFRRAAVIDVCFHAFCINCIRKWSSFKRNCPLCNLKFERLFFNISFSTGNCQVERLPESTVGANARFPRGFEPEGRRSGGRVTSRTFSRPHQLPWRRSFGRTRDREENLSRVLCWRASIYKKKLQAVPIRIPYRVFPSARDRSEKERVEQRVRPWIERELKALLGDLDASVIVHLATSLWALNAAEKASHPSQDTSGESGFVEKLRPFLQDQTDLFCHELRCFADSPFTMEAYDSVVEYRRLDSV